MCMARERKHDPLPWLPVESAFLLILAGFSVLYVMPLFFGGEWFVSHEMQHALVRLMEFHASLTGGRFPVRWSDNLMAGFGYPLFNFFPPFSFYMAEAFHLLGASLQDAWKLQLIFARFAGAAGMYGFLRFHAGRRGAALGSLMYLFAAYHASTLYVRGNLQEFTALNLWPLAFWGVDAVARHRHQWKGGAIPLAALALGALATTHMLTTYMAALHLLAFGTYLIVRVGMQEGAGGALRSLPLAASTAFLGFACAAYFVVPASIEIRGTQSAVLTDAIVYTEHFLTVPQLFKPTWGYGLSLPGPNDTMPLDSGISIWIGVVAGFGALLLHKTRPHTAFGTFSLVMFVATCFGMTRLSAPVWAILPKADYLQFPWRLLIPAAFWGCAAAGIAVGRGFLDRLDINRSHARLVFVGVLTVPALFVAPFLRPLLFNIEIPDYSPEAIRGVMTSTMAGEYLPSTADVMPTWRSRRIIRTTTPATVLPVEQEGASRYVALVDVSEEQFVSFDVFYYDGWKVRVDGQVTDSLPVSQHGLIGWRMPVGERVVEIRFEETPLRATGNTISLLAHLVVCGWLVIAGAGKLRRNASG